QATFLSPPLAPHPPFPYTTLFRSPIGPTSLKEATLRSGGVESPRPTQSAIADFATRMLVSAARRATEKRLAQGKVRTLWASTPRSEEHTSELQSRFDLVCRLLLEK